MSVPQLIICGSIARDRLMSFSGRYTDLIQPDKLDVLSLSVLVDSLAETRGGVGPNIAYASALLGNKPIMLGSIGSDMSDYLQTLASAGVSTEFTHISEIPSATFTAFTDADNNQVSGFYPGAMADSETVSFVPWANQDVLACLSAHDPLAMRRQAVECKTHGIRLFYDPGQQVSNVSGDDLRAGVEAAELVAVNEYERDILCEKLGITREALTAMVPILITTLGEKGSLLSGTAIGEPVQVNSAKPATIVDPTGAGDAYRAGFLHGYLRQWEPRLCAQLGSVVASFVLEQAGTQVPLSQVAIIERFKETYNEEVTL